MLWLKRTTTDAGLYITDQTTGPFTHAAKRYKGSAGRWIAFNTQSERSNKRGTFIQIPGNLQKDNRMSSQNWPPSSSKGENRLWKSAPRDDTKATLSHDTLLFPLQRKVSWVPQRQWVEYGIFFGTNSTAVHQLIEPGSQRGAQYRTLFLFLHLSY